MSAADAALGSHFGVSSSEISRIRRVLLQPTIHWFKDETGKVYYTKEGEAVVAETLHGIHFLDQGGPERSGRDNLREKVFTRDRGICGKCGVDCARYAIKWDAHHLDAVVEGGGDELQNLQTLCWCCHGEESAALRRLRFQERKAVRPWGLVISLLDNPSLHLTREVFLG